LKVLYLLPCLCVVALVPRLYYLQVVRERAYRARAENQHTQKITIIPSRGKILDRNEHELAGSTMLEAPYVGARIIATAKDPSAISDLAHEFAKILNTDFDVLLRRLKSRSDVPLARKVEPERVQAMKAVVASFGKRIPRNSIYFIQDGKRSYPRDDLACHVIGYTQLDNTGDNTGLEGIERKYNDVLRGETTEVLTRADAHQMTMEPIDPSVLEATFGQTVVLTIDENIQHATEVALKKSVNQNRAKGGVAVVYDVKTGEVLAMANSPSFDLNNIAGSRDFMRRNRAITDAIEPGSVMKIFTYTSLLDEDKLNLDEMINCEDRTWYIQNIHRTISDTHSVGVVPAWKAFAESSNIGAVKLGMTRLTKEQFNKHLESFGFGEPTGIDLPGEIGGKLRPLREWDDYSMSSLPMGYELMITGIQVAAAAGAIANGGVYMKPHIVREIRDRHGELIRHIQPEALRRVASPSACKKVLQLMEWTVEAGTGRPAAIPNYRVGGKTGTTRKTNGETNLSGDPAYIGSFCGIAPIDRPEVCIYIYIDNPNGSDYYGTKLAAPVFAEIAEASMKSLRIPPSPPDPFPRTKDNEIVEKKPEKKQVLAKAGPSAPEFTLEKPQDDDQRSTDSMPSVIGLTLREATAKLAKSKIHFRMNGSGVVLHQSPKPYETVERGTLAVLELGPLRDYIAQVSAREEGFETEPVSGSGHSYTVEPAVVTLKNSEDSAILTAKTTLPAPAAQAAVEKTAKPTPTPIPDMDRAAKRQPTKNGGKSWKQWKADQSTPDGDGSENSTDSGDPASSADRGNQKPGTADASRTNREPSRAKVGTLYEIGR
jgi:cell division protein FtsI (penicillin-binding protein 3)